MTRRFAAWLVVLVVADVVSWLLTIKTAVDYHPVYGDPSVMSVGQLLGWLLSIVLLLVVATMLNVLRLRRRARPRRIPHARSPRR